MNERVRKRSRFVLEIKRDFSKANCFKNLGNFMNRLSCKLKMTEYKEVFHLKLTINEILNEILRLSVINAFYNKSHLVN